MKREYNVVLTVKAITWRLWQYYDFNWKNFKCSYFFTLFPNISSVPTLDPCHSGWEPLVSMVSPLFVFFCLILFFFNFLETKCGKQGLSQFLKSLFRPRWLRRLSTNVELLLGGPGSSWTPTNNTIMNGTSVDMNIMYRCTFLVGDEPVGKLSSGGRCRYCYRRVRLIHNVADLRFGMTNASMNNGLTLQSWCRLSPAVCTTGPCNTRLTCLSTFHFLGVVKHHVCRRWNVRNKQLAKNPCFLNFLWYILINNKCT